MVEFTAATPFEAQLRAMADTGLFISVHTSNLANAQFLQPGSAVVEIIQRNWVWHNLDRSFQVCPTAEIQHSLGSESQVSPALATPHERSEVLWHVSPMHAVQEGDKASPRYPCDKGLNQ